MGLDFNVGMCITHDFFSLTILFFILSNFGDGPEKKRRIDGRLYHLIIHSTIILLLSDVVKLLINGKPHPWVHVVMQADQMLYFFFQAFIGMVWLQYCKYILTEDEDVLRRGRLLFVLSAAFALLIAAVSCFTPLLFWVDENNRYLPGPYKTQYYVFSVSYYVYAYLLILRDMLNDKDGRRKRRNKLLVFFPVPGLVGSLVQMSVDAGSIIWPLSTITTLILYHNVQNEKVSTDELTGLSNRSRFNVYLESRLRNLRRNKGTPLFLLMLDIDHFKQINDTFGHPTGDLALREIAGILSRAITPGDFLARIGGDEFAVVGKSTTPEAAARTISKIQHEIDLFNKSAAFPCKISISIGHSTSDTLPSAEQMLHKADHEMYLNKHRLQPHADEERR